MTRSPRRPFAALLIALLLTACAPAAGGVAEGGPALADGPESAWERRIAPFPVLDADGDRYEHPFLGGFDVPRPQFQDVDDDGDPDLFLQERSDEMLFFENTGTAEQPRWTWRSDRYADLSIGEWGRWHDMDEDGDLDLLAETPFSYVRYYRNEGTPAEPRLVLAVDTVRTADGDPLFADRQNIPSIVDIDCDGLPDLFLGRVDGTIDRYEMVPGTEREPRFRLLAERWEDIEIIGALNQPPGAALPNLPGAPPVPSVEPRPTLHGANAMAFSDVDQDGDLDLLWGDFFEPGLLLIENVGPSCEQPNFRSEPVPYPLREPLVSSGYNVPVPVDFDGDGDLDLLVGVLGGAFNPNRTASDNLWLLEQTAAGMELRTRRFLGAVDVGSESVPALADLDADGDLDLLVGNRIDPAGLDAARVYRWENIGSADEPAFRLADTLALGDAYNYAPALADLDADGDADLVTGTWNDEVLVFWNRGGPERFRVADEPVTLVELTRGSNSTPALGDVDGDGDLDLVVGEASGTLNFYRNTGTPAEPRFELVSDRWLDLDAGRRSHPALADLDGDGDPDLLVGAEDAGGLVLLNEEGRFRPATAAEAARLAPELPPYAAPALADLDGDGRTELLSGTLSGGLEYWQRRD